MHAAGSIVGLALLGGILCASHSGPLHAATTFTPLGDLPGRTYYSNAISISADGSVVVGESDSTSGFEAFRWTSGGGMVGLGDLPGGPFQSEAIDVSADGSVVVGAGNSASGFEAFRWTSGGGMVGLGGLPGASSESFAFGVSADGSVIVGYGATEALRWTAAGGMVGLGDLPGEPFLSGAFGISDDGAVVVGSGNAVQPETGPLTAGEAFRWTPDGGMVGLGDLPGGIFLSVPESASADGSVIVGGGNGDIGTAGAEAFRWTEGGGMVGLGDLPGGIFSSLAIDVSADGSVIVGFGTTALRREAFLWTADGGMQNLREVLLAGGATGLTGWTLREARGVSANGRAIVGYGTNPTGRTEAWLAVLDDPAVVLPDYDGNGLVEQADLDLVLLNWGSELLDPAAAGWINDIPSGPVDQGELDKVLLNWGASTAGVTAASIPEPATCIIAFIGCAAIAAIRSRYLIFKHDK